MSEGGVFLSEGKCKSKGNEGGTYEAFLFSVQIKKKISATQFRISSFIGENIITNKIRKSTEDKGGK